jgi:hypothetical protein
MPPFLASLYRPRLVLAEIAVVAKPPIRSKTETAVSCRIVIDGDSIVAVHFNDCIKRNGLVDG